MPEDVQEINYICPGKARSCTTFRFKAEAGYKLRSSGFPCSPEEIFHKTIEIAFEWLRRKTPELLPKPTTNKESFRNEQDGQVLEAVALPHKGLWAIRLIHPDVGMKGIPQVAGRTWTTDIAVALEEERVVLGVEVFSSTLNQYAQLPAFIRPGIIKLAIESIGLFQIRPLEGIPWILSPKEDLNELEELLTSPKRTLAVIVVSEEAPGNGSFLAEKEPHYTIDAAFLANELKGYAHVVQMPFDLSIEWTKKVGKPWSVYDGAVRTYLPGLDFESHSYFSHPLAIRSSILNFISQEVSITENKDGPQTFQSFLVEKTRKTMPRFSFSWDPLLFCTEARTLELSEMANGMLGGAECVSCRKVQSEQIFRLQEQIREIEGKSREWEELADSFSKELDFQKQQNYTLRNYADTLRISFRNSTGKVTDEEVTLPDDYESLLEWVEKNLSGRLLLLPRAVRSVKNAFYKDVSLVYKSLLLLAEEYRNMRLGFDTGKTFFEKRISELGVELGGSISNVSAGEYEDRYFVNYPTDSSSKRKLDFHLKKGNTKDDKFCMRIYFFWDEETNQVVVAHLPSHLESRMT